MLIPYTTFDNISWRIQGDLRKNCIAGPIVLTTAALLVLSHLALAQQADLSKAPTHAGRSSVKVFILAGQSNMEGHGFIAAEPKRNGGKGSLEFLVKDAATAKRFAHLVDAAGQWRTRDDVWITYLLNPNSKPPFGKCILVSTLKDLGGICLTCCPDTLRRV